MVSKVFAWGTDAPAPYDAAEKLMLAEWHEAGLVLAQADRQSGVFDALEMLQVRWDEDVEDGAEMLLAASQLIQRTDIPLTLVSSSGRAMAVPQSLWDSNRAPAEFSFWHKPQPNQQVFAHPTEHRIMIHWELPEAVWQFFTGRFAITTSRHVLHGLLAEDHQPEPGLHLLAVADNAWVTIFNKGRLQHVQHIPLSASDAFTYALLDRCRLHGIDPVTTPLVISGRLAKEGTVMTQIGRFFGHIVWNGQSAPIAEDMPDHYFAYLKGFVVSKEMV